MKPDFLDDSASSFGCMLLAAFIFIALIIVGIILGLMYLFGAL
jgi:hypothetical protein